ncbi:MAG TPA: 16S rRNA processing protein RimM, partial [Gammaproteobacteria bacterium]|nr:16S rRNA processing protein RimM [Gammaproteobacteria bacterium]
KGVVCHLKGYDDRAQARELVDVDIAVAADRFSKLESGEYYWYQLEGLEVVNLSGESLGKVDRLLETGANDVLVLKGEQERLVPYTPGVVAEVDLNRGRIQVDWEKDY